MPSGRIDVAAIAAVVVVKTVAELCSDVAQIAPVPGLAPAATLVLTILALCQGVTVNNRESVVLAERSVCLLQVLQQGTQGLPDSLFHDAVRRCCDTLATIEQQYKQWNTYNKLKNMLLCSRIADEIQQCHAIINQCMSELNVASSLDTAQWQARAEEARQIDHQEILQHLDTLLEGQLENREQLSRLIQEQSEAKAQLTSFMGVIQDSLVNFEQGDRRHQDLQQKLYNVKQATHELPPKTHLRGKEVRRIGQHPVGMGAQFDIWEGELFGNEKVALKILRGVQAKPKQFERFLRESKIWREVWEVDRGQYILAYLGTVTDDGPYPYMVSPWQRNGNAISWVQHNQDVPRYPLIKGIASGLKLLHTWNPNAIVHGDIKGENILIGDRGQPLITDFSLSKILEEVTGTPFTQSKGISDSYRWFAPEICSAPGILSVQSDIFSFGMTILELITGQVPFKEVKRTTEVLFNMQRGLRPKRPEEPIYLERGLTDNMWNLMQRCWAHTPEERIAITEFLNKLG